MSKFADNDDDLFDYDPSTDNSPTTPINVNPTIKFETEGPLADTTAKFFDDIKNHFDADIENLTGNIVPNKYKLAASFSLAYDLFLKEGIKDASAKSVAIVLNTLTNGDFSLMTMFYETEIKISKKIFFLELITKSFLQESSQNDVLKKLDDLLHINFTPLYIKTCFQSTVNICMHSLELDRATYLTLSKRLGIPVQQELFGPIEECATKDHKVYLDDYKQSLSEQVHNILIESGMLQEVSSVFNQPVKLSNSKLYGDTSQNDNSN